MGQQKLNLASESHFGGILDAVDLVVGQPDVLSDVEVYGLLTGAKDGQRPNSPISLSKHLQHHKKVL